MYVNDVLQLFHDECDEALVLLVPVRLGSEALNPIYIPCIQGLLSLNCCVGIIGGRPKHSVYFIGFQGGSVFSPPFLPNSQSPFFHSVPSLSPTLSPTSVLNAYLSCLDDKLIHLDPHYCQSAQTLQDNPSHFDTKVTTTLYMTLLLSTVGLFYSVTVYNCTGYT